MKNQSSREEENAARRSERSREEENAERRYPTSLDRGVARGVRRVRRLGVRGVALPLVQMNQSSERGRSHSLGVVVLKKKRTRFRFFAFVRSRLLVVVRRRRRVSRLIGREGLPARRVTVANPPRARAKGRKSSFRASSRRGFAHRREKTRRSFAATESVRLDRSRLRRGSLLRARAGMKRKAYARTLASACAFHPPPELRLIRRSCRCTPRRRRFACARRPWARRRSRGSPGLAPCAPPCPPPSPRADAPSPGPPSLGFSPRCAS